MEALKVIASIDQGTQSTRCILYDSSMNTLESSSKQHKQYYPQSGWCEHDPNEIIESVYYTMNEAVRKLKEKVDSFVIVGLGITNQRETIVVWDKKTGIPLYNAIVWLDIRASEEANHMVETFGSDRTFYQKTGLLINTYFSAFKLKWMSNNLSWFNECVANESIRFGTIDTWLIYNLTGEYLTDITNASRTFLMDINKEKWSSELIKIFGFNFNVLPEIRSNCSDFGTIINKNVPDFNGVKILGVAGDQQASCVGQGLFEKLATKCTFGTGAFILTNTGTERVMSSGGLLCTPCYKLSANTPTTFALEGSIAIAGAGVTWLKDMGMISEPSEISEILLKYKSSDGVVFAPAFSGLFAPRWRSDARGCIMGMTQHTERGHIVRAYCESIGLQLYEIIQSFLSDMGVSSIPYINVDGGLSQNSELLQLISDITNTKLEKPEITEITSYGAALLAGLGAKLWDSLDEVKKFTSKSRVGRVWTPSIPHEERHKIFQYWNMGIERSLLWHI
ncbi:glycerol kinase [Theileria orientalis]|uniref:glycerol kinase n=1 Tax=Theileria orientalis TaxID=68886 RepID=A0A976QTT0_THEOR|nr:glycerol kinase [Theileria orientalis]